MAKVLHSSCSPFSSLESSLLVATTAAICQTKILKHLHPRRLFVSSSSAHKLENPAYDRKPEAEYRSAMAADERGEEGEGTGLSEGTPVTMTHEKDDKPLVDDSVENEAEPQKVDDKKDEWLDILGSGQIMKKVVKEGEKDTRPQRLDVCLVNIEGKLPDGTVIEKYDNLSLHVGDGEVISGLDLVITLMDVGEIALVEVGPRFGFGSQGRSAENSLPAVPADVKLTYTVELIDAKPEPELESVPITVRKEIGNRKRERGNWWYGRGENTLAIQCYRRALDYLDEAVGGIQIEPDNAIHDPAKEDNENTLMDVLEDRIKVYNNLAAAQLKIGALEAALMSVENVLRCQPNNVKALFRKSKILAEKGENQTAVEVLERITILDPDNRTIRSELKTQRAKAKENTQQQRNLYRKMMGGSTSNMSAQKKVDNVGRSKDDDSSEEEEAPRNNSESSRCCIM